MLEMGSRTMLEPSHPRQRMVDNQIARRGINDRYVLEAMRKVPREAFVAPTLEEFAYADTALPIEESQTISQPYIVALMIEAAAVRPDDRVLEVGAGSGYAVAVLSQIADAVYAIERHPTLADAARERFARLGYLNVTIRLGDGTLGWPEAAPFDAILVSAGGPDVPPALKHQLAIGGRLVIPVGGEERSQDLLKITRTGKTAFAEENLGSVRFVPLVGKGGWPEPGEGPEISRPARRPRKPDLPQLIANEAEPLPACDDPAFGILFARFADRRVVLLGEASHGTSEFYQARAAISRHLIEQHGFEILAVEADWPDAAAIDRYVRHLPPQSGLDKPFQRFPAWMWRNAEVLELVEWLRRYNSGRAAAARVGFYGLDMYNMSGSIAALLSYLDKVDPEAARVARERYGCLTPWQKEPSTYGRAVLSAGYHKCEEAVIAQCRELLQRRLQYSMHDNGGFLDAAQNARLVAAAERYYRVMYYGGADAWNLRDTHMFETLCHVLDARGATCKAVVWAHNSHIGDARHTEMGGVRDELNLGQLCRQHFGDDAALIGFGTHSGTVAAASDWDGPMEVKPVRPSHPDSYERLCHASRRPRFLLDLRPDGVLRRRMAQPRLERFIGVVYRPETEFTSHYAEASLPQQFDAYVWFDETTALTPLATKAEKAELPDTYPFGL
jgi:protein-L-isoaspartate(D-aspartate) O-methyltransferase